MWKKTHKNNMLNKITKVFKTNALEQNIMICNSLHSPNIQYGTFTSLQKTPDIHYGMHIQ